jgi:hypothetical protein
MIFTCDKVAEGPLEEFNNNNKYLTFVCHSLHIRLSGSDKCSITPRRQLWGYHLHYVDKKREF